MSGAENDSKYRLPVVNDFTSSQARRVRQFSAQAEDSPDFPGRQTPGPGIEGSDSHEMSNMHKCGIMSGPYESRRSRVDPFLKLPL